MFFLRHVKSFLASPFFILAITAMGLVAASPMGLPNSAGGYFVPAEVPHSRYVIDVRIDFQTGMLEGKQAITFENLSTRPITILALEWDINGVQTIEVSANGAKLAPRREAESNRFKAPVFYELPSPVAPGDKLTLSTVFLSHLEPSAADGFGETHWYPRLWWEGRCGHDDYSVKLDTPPGFAVAASGRKNELTGRFEGAGIKAFGLYLAKGVTAETREADGVLVTALSTPKGKGAAAVCLETAVDAVKFYKHWVGFYPYPFLTIIPGGTGRWGGDPFAPGIVAIHGLETYKDGESPKHWQHITSHEIGHQYWGEWVLDCDNPPWLWIAMGIHMDTNYMLARNYDPERRREWMGSYINAVGMFYDTTLDTTLGQEDRYHYDRNNLVVHSKGPAFLNALEVVLGSAEFDRLFRDALRSYGGKPLGWREFQCFCEHGTGQNLAWFFEPWVRGNSYLCYTIESRDCRPDGLGFRSEVRVRRLGTMAMPIPLKAVFEDGTDRTVLTDRTKDLDTVVFESQARLKDVVLDPERRMAMVAKPLPEIPADAAAMMSMGWDAARSAAIYDALTGVDFDSPDLWHELGRGLFEIDRLSEAAESFRKLSDTPGDAGADYRFLGTAWLGLIDDLRGNRKGALEHYQAALGLEKGQLFRYGSLNLRIDRTWLVARLETPYTRKFTPSLPDHPTADQLVELVNGLEWTHEGQNSKAIFDRTAGINVPLANFWFKLGMVLFDSGAREESLAAFTKAAAAPDASPLGQFGAWVWQGHLNDLLGRRGAALAAYHKAIELDTGKTMSHGQYGMSIHRKWVEARLKSPFVWGK